MKYGMATIPADIISGVHAGNTPQIDRKQGPGIGKSGPVPGSEFALDDALSGP